MSDLEVEVGPPPIDSDRDKEKENTENATPDETDLKEEEDPASPDRIFNSLDMIEETQDEETRRQDEIVANTKPTTELEKALLAVLARKDALIERITGEITKLKSFVQKRKQTYKRKRKEDGAPTRALSAYNLFIKERFEQLAKENEKALKSDDAGAELKRVPPSNLVAKTGNEWKELPAEIKAQYEERAKADRKRYQEQMAEYQPPDKHSNRKRNKTGYNMFFSAHVLRLKTSENGVPSERGSVARLVGNAWKSLSAEDKQYYEREADKHNGTNPSKEGDEEDDEEEMKLPQHHLDHQYPYPAHGEMAHHPMPGLHVQHPPPHDPLAHHPYYAPHMYAQNPYGHYDYSQHHQRHPQGRQQMYQYAPQGRHYDNTRTHDL
ncbi:hypothetical protein ACA910_012659 [Epithemia clementina (nom. ined.)]